MLPCDLWNSLLFSYSISSFTSSWAGGRISGSSLRHRHMSDRKGCVMSISCRSSLRRMYSGTIFPSKSNQRKKLFSLNLHENMGPRQITSVEKGLNLIHCWLRLQVYIILFQNKDSRSTSYITDKVLKALKKSYPLLYFIFLRDNINCRLQAPPIITPHLWAHLPLNKKDIQF